MCIYSVIPLSTDEYQIKDFEDLYEAITWQDELAMMGIKSTIERIGTYFAA